MAIMHHAKWLLLGVLIIPLPLWADADLDYQNRGDRFEGVKPKPVSGYDIEVISVLADYREPAERLPDQLRVGFFLQSQTPVHLTVREQDYRLYYWLDRVKPANGWQTKSVNEYTWPTRTVLRQLDQKLNLYELGVLIRLGKETPAENEEIAPAILYHEQPPDKIGGYLFTMKTNGDARLSCKVFRGKEPTEIMTQVFRRIPGGRPFTVRWEAGTAPEGQYTLIPWSATVISSIPISPCGRPCASFTARQHGSGSSRASRLLKNYFGISGKSVVERSQMPSQYPTGCSKRHSSKAAASEEARRTRCRTLSL